ncbi:MAG: hypothetical protein KDC33_09075 [Thermoleophilia bacterium]|nr:hypothetical protein [Thermoleophilia bacterium]
MAEVFPLRRSRWAFWFVAPLAPRGGTVEVEPGVVRVRFGLLGKADVPTRDIAGVGRTTWPLWAGLGVRIARGTVAFAADGGDAVVLELRRELDVRAPLRWSTRRIVLVVEHPDRFAAAVAAAAGAEPVADEG